MGDAAALAAALAFERDCYVRAAASATPHPLGVALRDDAVPDAHIVNMLCVTVATAEPAALLDALEETQAGLGHRKAQVDAAALGAALRAPLAAAGFTAERHVVMVLRRSPDRAAGPGLAREAGVAAHAEVENASTREFPHGRDEAVVQQLTRARAAVRAAAPRGTRRFVGTADGVPAAHATLLSGDGVAQLEDVGTLAAHRGRGLGRAVCTLALDAARGDGTPLVFVVADADDWPRELYAKLGFDPVGTVWAFTRAPA